MASHVLLKENSAGNWLKVFEMKGIGQIFKTAFISKYRKEI